MTHTHSADTGRPLRPATFTIHDMGRYPGYTYGETWDGWAQPYFTKAVAEQIVALWNADPASEMSGTYDAETDTYTLCDPLSGMEPETFTGEAHLVDGRPMQLYPIGAGLWVWDEEKDDETPRAHCL